MTIRATSKKALMQYLRLSDGQAFHVRHVIKLESRDALSEFAESEYPEVWRWIRSCFNPPKRNEIRARLLDEICETHGVEYIKAKDAGILDPPLATYLNAGDTYAPTLVYYRGRWQITTWGDIAERHLLD